MPEKENSLSRPLRHWMYIKVGTPSRSFFCHTQKISRHSAFFRNEALTRPVGARGQLVVLLPDEDPDAFHCFLIWLKTGTLRLVLEHYNINSELDDEPYEPCGDVDDGSWSWSTSTMEFMAGSPAVPPFPNAAADGLFKLWILASNIGAPHAQNMVAHQLLDLASERYWRHLTAFPSNEVLELVYRKTSPGSPLRALAMDVALATRLNGDLEDSMKELSPTILQDMAFRSVRLWKQDQRSAQSICAYLQEHRQAYNVLVPCADEVDS